MMPRKVTGINQASVKSTSRINETTRTRATEAGYKTERVTPTQQEIHDRAVFNATHTGAVAGEKISDSTEFTQMDKFISELSRTLENVKRNEKELDTRIANLQARIERLKAKEKDSPQVKEAIAQLQGSLERLRAQKQSLVSIRNRLQAQIDSLKNGKPYNAPHQQLINEMRKYHEEMLANIDKQISLIDEKYKPLYDAKTAELTKLNAKLNEAISKASQASDTKEAEKWAKQATKLQDQIARVSQERARIKAEWDAHRNKLLMDRQAVEQHMFHSQSMYNNMFADPGVAANLSGTLGLINSFKAMNMASLAGIDASYNAKLQALQSKRVELQNMINAKRAQLATEKDPEKRKQLQQEIEGLQGQLSQIEPQMEQLKSEWIAARNQNLQKYLEMQKAEQDTMLQAWQQMNELRRERENVIWADFTAEMRHQNELWKMLNDTLTAIRQMWYDSLQKQMQLEEGFVQGVAGILGSFWG